jgi:dolichol kinase
MVLSKEEINRKLLHVFSGTLIPAGIFYIPMIDGYSSFTPVIALGVLTLGSILLEYLRFNNSTVQKLFTDIGSGVLRKSEKNSFTGSTYIFLSAFLCSIIFFNHPHIAFIALSLFILGDAIAAIVGISMGRIKIGKKSLEGSAACFILGLLLFFFIYPQVPMLLDRWHGSVPLPLICIASFSNTIFELFPVGFGKKLRINDNLSVPLITGLILLVLYPVFA